MAKKLEETIIKIEKTKEKLKQIMFRIDEYNKLGSNTITPEKYKMDLDIRDNLAIRLDYLQNEVIIEQNSQLIKYLKELKK